MDTHYRVRPPATTSPRRHEAMPSTYANLPSMAQGDHGREFTAMITAVRAWAETQKGRDHPFRAIKGELLQKASGRVVQTDTDIERMSSDNSSRRSSGLISSRERKASACSSTTRSGLKAVAIGYIA